MRPESSCRIRSRLLDFLLLYYRNVTDYPHHFVVGEPVRLLKNCRHNTSRLTQRKGSHNGPTICGACPFAPTTEFARSSVNARREQPADQGN